MLLFNIWNNICVMNLSRPELQLQLQKLKNTYYLVTGRHIEQGWKQKARQRSSLRFGGATFFQFLAALANLSRSI